MSISLLLSTPSFKSSFRSCYSSRRNTIKELKAMSEELKRAKEVQKGLKIGGGAIAIGGGLLTIAGGIASIVTAGAAIPFLVGGLVWTGVGIGATGGVIRAIGGVYEKKSTKSAIVKLNDVLMQDHRAYQDLICLLRNLEDQFKGEQAFANFLAFISWCIPNLFTMDCGKPVINQFLNELFVGVTSIDCLKIQNGITFFNSTAKTAAQALLGGADDAASAGAQAATRAATETAVKTAARVAGGVAVGLGAVFIIYDSILIYQDATKETVGDFLVKIASVAESRMRGDKVPDLEESEAITYKKRLLAIMD